MSRIHMSSMARSVVLSLTVVMASLTGALVVEQLAYGAGVAHAEATPLDAGAVDAAPADALALSSAAPAPVPAPPVIEPDPEIAARLWRSGAFLDAGIVVAYLLLGLWRKLDKKHAFYATAALAGLATVIETAVRGQTPTAAMIAGAATTLLAILIRGPAKPDVGA